MNLADLKAVIRHRGIKRPRRRLPRMRQPDQLRLAYFRELKAGPLRDMRAAVEHRVVVHLHRWLAEVPRRDAADDPAIHDAIEHAVAEMQAKWSARRIRDLVTPLAGDIDRFSRDQLIAVMKDTIGIDVLGAEPDLAPEMARWVSENVSLIKTVPGRFFPDLEQRLVAGVHNGERWEVLSDMVEERSGVAESNAVRIARDQTGKLNGQLNQKRQENLGIEKFVWRTMKDNRVRDEHEARDGEAYEWSAPPDGEIPGEPIQCRCWAEPDVSVLFDD